MLPPYLDEPRNLWAPAIAIGVSTVSTALYGVKDQTNDASIYVAVVIMVCGGFAIATFLGEEIHERIRFLVMSSLVFVIVLVSWFIAGAAHKSVIWLTPLQSNLVLCLYCAFGFWALLTKQSRRAFEAKDPIAFAFAGFVIFVFVFPVTNASAYSNDLGIMFWHYALYTLLYFMRVAYVLNFEKQHPSWLLVQTVFGTIWLLDVPFFPSIPIYLTIFSFTVYKFSETETKHDLTDDTQLKRAYSKPIPKPVEPPRQVVTRAVYRAVPLVKWNLSSTPRFEAPTEGVTPKSDTDLV